MVDSAGRLWAVVVQAANLADGRGALPLLDQLESITARLEKFLGDTSYTGVFAKAVESKGYQFEKSARFTLTDTKVEQPKKGKKFIVESKRWVIERSGPATGVHRLHAWTNFFRRITKDYERTVESAATWLLVANSTIMLQRIHN